MTLLRSALERRSPENPQIPLSSPEIVDWLDGQAKVHSGVRVSERTALSLITVYRCVELIAGTCAALPLKAFRVGTKERIAAPVLDDPHPELTAFEVWEVAYACLLLWGNAYFRKLRDGTGRVRHLWPIHPSRVDPRLVDPSAANPGGKVFRIQDKEGGYRDYGPDEVLQIPGLGYDGVKGLSRIQLARQGIGLGLAAEEYAARFFGSGSLMSGILSTDKSLDQKAAESLKARWKEKVGGLSKAHEIAVLDNGAKFQPVSISPEDAELLATQQWSTLQIVQLFGLPPHAVSIVENSTSWGTGIEQQTIGMVQFTLQPSYLTRVEQRLTKHVLMNPGLYAEYTVEGLLRGDSAARGEFYSKAIQNGWLSRNSVRQRENEEPIDGGDEMLLPAGVLPVSVSETKAKVDAAGALVRAGFDPLESLAAVGLDPIKHTGMLPVTVQPEGDDDESEADRSALPVG